MDDPQLVPSAIGLVIARYLADPERFDPERGGLAGYLAMEVRGDVLNELDSRRRRRRHESPAAELVELEPHGRDSTVEEEALDAVDPIGVSPAAVQAARQALGELDVNGEVEISREGPAVDAAGVRQAADVPGPAATTNQTGSAAVQPDRAALERAFHAAMVEVYRRARQEAGYQAGYFLQMLSEHGGLETARRLLHAPIPSEGFTALWKRRRLDLTVEAVVLKPEFAALFTDEDRDIARTRLREYGYSEGE